jgi:hypothetical protein
MPIWAEFSSTPAIKFLMSIGRLCHQTKLKKKMFSLAGVPSWMLVLLNKMLLNLEKKIYLIFGLILKYIFMEVSILIRTARSTMHFT